MAAIIDQLNTRIDPAAKVAYDAAAAALGCTTSQIVREVLEQALPGVQERAKEAVAKAGKWPGTIPAAAVEAELSHLLRSIARSEPLAIAPADLLGARGKAFSQLFGWIFDEDDASPVERKAREKVHAWLAGLELKAAAGPGSPNSPGGLPNAQPGAIVSKPVKNYPRRGE